jgi:hypothetical protein
MNMKSIIKENLTKKTLKEDNLQEDKIQINNVKPLNRPNKINKSITQNQNVNTNEGKDNRLKAYSLMKKKIISREEINELSKVNIENELLNKNIYEGSVYIQGKIENERNKPYINNSKTDLSLINQFEDYYRNKFEEKESHENENNLNINPNLNLNKNELYEVNLDYIFGINMHNANSLCFHKKEKWVAYLNKNLIIIENFQEETERKQIILPCVVSNNNYLDAVKLSENGKILMAYSMNSNPIIIFYSYDPIKEEKYTLINKVKIKHSKIIDCEISPQNTLCLVISKI